MEQKTIIINGEECVIMPAPKGAFITGNNYANYSLPRFVQYVAVSTDAEFLTDDNESVGLNVYTLSHAEGELQVECYKYEDLCTYVHDNILHTLYKECVNGNFAPPREELLMLYQEFKSHGTPFDYSAIKWFKEKFKEHNITKADFDVFA